ncbi:MAG: asparaginase [Firmicutes bacterium]|nr:asparaginase [Bacillota bacterium]
MTHIVAHVLRGDRIESVHHGHVAVVDATGRLLHAYGDPHIFTYTRSAMKPVQALPLVETGAADAFAFEQRDIALCCASHHAEREHVLRVAGMLERVGLSTADLQCGAHPPYHQPTARQMAARGEEPTALHNNCSGNHVGMLAATVKLGAAVDAYLNVASPVQAQILEALCSVTELSPAEVGLAVDGCSAPVFGIPLASLALLYARLANPETAPSAHEKSLERIRDAMIAHSDMVGGSESFCTALMVAGKGAIVSKAGAEGVYAVGLVGKRIGLAVKIADGNARAVGPVVCSALAQLGHALDQGALADYARPVLKNAAGTTVGAIQATLQLQEVH